MRACFVDKDPRKAITRRLRRTVSTVPNGGGVPEWLKGTDCKSVGVRLRWFESNPLHHRMVFIIRRACVSQNAGLRRAAALARGCSSMVESQPSKLAVRVRFPSPAPAGAPWSPLPDPSEIAFWRRGRTDPQGKSHDALDIGAPTFSLRPPGPGRSATSSGRARRGVAQLARAPVSKTGGWGFETLHPCQRRLRCLWCRVWPRRTGPAFSAIRWRFWFGWVGP